MKKIISFAVTMAVFAMLASAEITVGVRGIFGLGIGTAVDDFTVVEGFEYKGLQGTITEDVDCKTDTGKCIDYGFALFAKIPVYDKLSIQPELGFTHKQIGVKMTATGTATLPIPGTGLSWTETETESEKIKVSYNTIDIPVLAVYDIDIAKGFTVSPLLGPKFSIPIGKLKSSDWGDWDDGDDEDEKIDSKLLFSVVAGVSAAYDVGPGAIVADLRYDLGLSKLKTEDGILEGTPRALQFSIGYQMKL